MGLQLYSRRESHRGKGILVAKEASTQRAWEAAGLRWVSVRVPEPVPFPRRCESFGRRC